MDYFAHETAVIDTDCIIGKGTKIWHFSHIQTGAIIGENCSIGQNVNIGNNVKIQNNVSIYDNIVLKDNVFRREDFEWRAYWKTFTLYVFVYLFGFI